MLITDRRTWLRSAMALAVATQLPARARNLARPALLTAWVADDQAMAGLWHTDGRLQGVELPNRAHEVLAMPGALGQQGMALAVGRRPGEYLLRFDARSAKALQWHDMEMDRFLCGHAAFSHDGQTLYTPEFDAASGDGLIVERDPMTLRKRREYASGLGPHAMLVEPDGNLLVANGGLLILPETGRRKLNREHMDSSLVRLDGKTGRLLDTWRVADPFLSLRHIARTPDGHIAVASQAEHLEDAARNAAPLLHLLDTKKGLTSVALPAGMKLGGYAGDIAYVPDAAGPAQRTGRYVLSATRAGQLAWWSPQGEWLGQQALPKASAIAVTDAGQWLASGDRGTLHGQLAQVALDTRATGVRWDNHAVLVGA